MASKKRAIAKNQLQGFGDFAREQGVVGLAVGLVIGAAVATLVNSLINNLIMPPLGFVLGSAEGLKGLTFSMGTTPNGQEAVIRYGAFLNDFINFVVIAFVVYYVVHGLGLDKKLDKKK